MPGRDRLVVALDFPDGKSALAMAGRLRGEVGLFKVGKQLFTAEGPGLVRELVGNGDQVFLDLKYHDIPNTVAGAVEAAVRLGVGLVNVHASGGRAMLRAAAQAAQGSRTRVLGVTVLTSLGEADLAEVGFAEPPGRLVLRLACLAREAGLDGVVASPNEIGLLRGAMGRDFLIVTPGVRPAEAWTQDQVRVATPQEALWAGADYIVVGRPITQAPDPAAAARTIVQMLE